VYLATAPEMADVSGQYFMDRKVRELTAAARDDVLAARMWDLSAELTGLKRGDRGQRGTINETTGARS